MNYGLCLKNQLYYILQLCGGTYTKALFACTKKLTMHKPKLPRVES